MGLLTFWMFIHLALICTSTCQALSANVHLRKNVERLNRITDGLQKDVSYMLTAMTSSGIQSQEFGNRTRTDTNSFGQQGEGITAELNETVNDVKQLKSEVQSLILHSRNGFKNEKKFRREAIRVMQERYEAFQTDQSEKNRDMDDQIERLLKEGTEVNSRLNENVYLTEDHDSRLERMGTMMETLNAKQNRLESENQELKLKLGDKYENVNAKQSRLESENQELKQELIGMQENVNTIQSKLDSENQGLKEELICMQEELAHVRALVNISKCIKGWIGFHGSCYRYVYEAKTWSDAVATCVSKGGYLVEVTTQSEMEFIAELRHKRDPLWVGATDEANEGSFVYQHSKRRLPNTFWRDGEPNNSRGVEHCVQLINNYGKKDAKLNDVKCTTKYTFVCEKSATPIEQ